jgi:hypothetical protein
MTLEEIVTKAKGDAEAALEAAIQEAYNEGFLEGRKSLKLEMLKALALDAGDGVLQHAVVASEPDMFQDRQSRRVVAKRAPKGLTKRVLKRVLMAHPEGMKMEDVQAAAVAMDSQISPKTIYNELYRRTEAYVKDGQGLWRLKSETRGGNASWVAAQPREEEPAQ